MALILFAVSQRASPLSTLTWWAPSSVHEKGSVKIIRGVAVRSVRPCCVQNPHRWGLSWAVPAWACVRACVRVCTCVCKCARAPKSGRASLRVSLLTSVFPRISESKTSWPVSHVQGRLAAAFRPGIRPSPGAGLQVPEATGAACARGGLRVPVEACCPQPPSCHPWVGMTMAVPLLPTGSCRAWPAPGAPCVRRAARAAPLRSPLPLRRHLRRVGY